MRKKIVSTVLEYPTEYQVYGIARMPIQKNPYSVKVVWGVPASPWTRFFVGYCRYAGFVANTALFSLRSGEVTFC